MEDEQPTAAEVASQQNLIAAATGGGSLGGDVGALAAAAEQPAVVLSATAAPRVRTPRIRSIDSLRGVAALCVMLWHYTNYEIFDGSIWQMKLGYLGVDLFFVISGFVIFMTVEGARSIGAFAFALTRLYPTFLFATIVVYIIWFPASSEVNDAIDPGPPPSVGNFFLNLTMMGDFFDMCLPGFQFVVSSAWTLALETWFYVWIGVLFVTHQLKHWHWYMLAWMVIEVLSDHVFVWPSESPHWLYMWMVIFELEYIHLFAAGMALYGLFKRYGHLPESEPEPKPELNAVGKVGKESSTERTERSGSWAASAAAAKENTPLLGRSLSGGADSGGDVEDGQPPPAASSKAASGPRHAGRVVLEFFRASCLDLLVLLAAFLVNAFSKSPWGSGRRYANWQWINPLFCVFAYGMFTLIICTHRWRSSSRVFKVVGSVLEKEYFVFFGTISYALYLIHEEAGYFMLQGWHGSQAPQATFPPLFGVDPAVPAGGALFIVMCTSIVAATGITFLYEQPVMERMRQWYKWRERSRAQ